MRIIYVSKTCSNETFHKLYQASIVKPQQQDQKFHQMMIEGFAENQVDVHVISSRPINRDNLKKAFFLPYKEVYQHLSYHYLFFINIKLLRQISLMLSIFFKLLWMLPKKRKQTVIFCDILNVSLSLVTKWMARLFRVNHVAVVTDLPDELDQQSKHYKRITTRVAKQYQSYVILTDSMNSIINPKMKPAIRIEGMIRPIQEIGPVKKNEVFTFMYAGGLSKSSNIMTLIDAFIEANLDHTELMICGQGYYAPEIITIAKDHPNIRFMGSLINQEVILLERKAHALINPRSKKESQTRFSFPSKIMEYLSSGTPTLSTRLEGIPDEYFNYLIPLDDESKTGFMNALRRVRNESIHELEKRGLAGQTFVYTYKTNKQATKLILDWLDIQERKK